MSKTPSSDRKSFDLISVPAGVRAAAAPRHIDQILQSFNTWAFKRAQPSDSRLLGKVVKGAVLRQEPISFVLYWGKGPRSSVGAYEAQCLDFLSAMATRVDAVYDKGAAFNLLLTDTHALLNGHAAHDVTRYFAEVAEMAGTYGFASYLLGDLCTAAGTDVAAPADCAPSDETLDQLARSAMRWYRGAGTAEDGARTYYRMNMFEREVVEHFFPTSVFVTFNGHEHRELFPARLPIFYMYSLKRGTSVKPWFLPDPADASNSDGDDQLMKCGA